MDESMIDEVFISQFWGSMFIKYSFFDKQFDPMQNIFNVIEGVSNVER